MILVLVNLTEVSFDISVCQPVLTSKKLKKILLSNLVIPCINKDQMVGKCTVQKLIKTCLVMVVNNEF